MSAPPSSARDRPDFLVIGAMKSGTTTLYRDLGAVSGIHLPSVKEPWLLVEPRATERLTAGYARLFRDAPAGALCGDLSTGYAMRPAIEGVAARARALCGPDLRVVYLMREPVARALSHVRHDVRVGRLAPAEAPTAPTTHPVYADTSDYPMQLLPWLEHFGHDRVLGLSFERYVEARTATVDRVLRFVSNGALGTDLTFDGVANRHDALLHLPGLGGRIASSTLYRHRLHGLVPRWLRDGLKRGLAREVDGAAEAEVSATSRTELERRLADVADATERLLGHPVWTRRDVDGT